MFSFGIYSPINWPRCGTSSICRSYSKVNHVFFQHLHEFIRVFPGNPSAPVLSGKAGRYLPAQAGPLTKNLDAEEMLRRWTKIHLLLSGPTWWCPPKQTLGYLENCKKTVMKWIWQGSSHVDSSVLYPGPIGCRQLESPDLKNSPPHPETWTSCSRFLSEFRHRFLVPEVPASHGRGAHARGAGKGGGKCSQSGGSRVSCGSAEV